MLRRHPDRHLLSFVEGALPAAQHRRVEQHLERCRRCRCRGRCEEIRRGHQLAAHLRPRRLPPFAAAAIRGALAGNAVP